jgi:hypothetical protein
MIVINEELIHGKIAVTYFPFFYCVNLSIGKCFMG